MTTLDESRAALAAADAQLRNAAQLASVSLPVLWELVGRVGEEGPEALHNLSAREVLAVRHAIVVTLASAVFGRAKHEYEQEIAQTN